MRVLGIETSTGVEGVAVVERGRLLGEWTLNLPQSHSIRLLPSIDGLLRALGMGIEEVDGIAVSIGPGSFTGLRIGLSTAKGLSMSLGKPLLGVPTLKALALPFSSWPYLLCPLIDARRGELYVALYRSRGDELDEVLSPQVLPPEEVVERLRGEGALLVGDGALLYKDLFLKELGDRAYFPPPPLHHPRASAVAFLGEGRLLRGERDDLLTLTPLYVRPSDAELKSSP